MRRRSTQFVRKLVQLDAFPKLETNAAKSTDTGGLATVLISIVLVYLTWTQLLSYFQVQQKYEFLVDQIRTGEHSLQINIDMSINMPCEGELTMEASVGLAYDRGHSSSRIDLQIDIVDVSGERITLREDALKKTEISWEEDSKAFKELRDKELDSSANIRKIIKAAGSRVTKNWPKESENGVACRLKAMAHVNKMTGMIHITPLARPFLMLTEPMQERMNFTHRIHSFSFGKVYSGLANPLDDTYEFADSSKTIVHSGHPS